MNWGIALNVLATIGFAFGAARVGGLILRSDWPMFERILYLVMTIAALTAATLGFWGR